MSGHRPWSEVRRSLPPGASDYARRQAAKHGPRWSRAYARTYRRGMARRRNPRPLCIDGHAYHRKQMARRRRRGRS